MQGMSGTCTGLTGDDRGVQGVTGAYSGTQGLCTGADRERQRLFIRTGVSRGSSVNSINFITRGPAVITQTALSLVKVYCNKNQFLNKPGGTFINLVSFC